MCEFCKTDEDGYAENGDKSITLGKLGNLHATLDFITEENKKSYLYISANIDNVCDCCVELKKKINYCPMCGRKL